MARFILPRLWITGRRTGPRNLLFALTETGASGMNGERPMPLAAVTAAKRAGWLVLMIVIFTTGSPSSL
jgi:hypothetical protein